MEESAGTTERRGGGYGARDLSRLILAAIAGGVSWWIISARSAPPELLLIPVLASLTAITGIFSTRPGWSDRLAVLIVVSSLLPTGTVQLLVASWFFALGVAATVWCGDENRWGSGGPVLTAIAAAPLILTGIPDVFVWMASAGLVSVIALELALRTSAAEGRFGRIVAIAMAVLIASVLPVASWRQAFIPLALAVALILGTRRTVRGVVLASAVAFLAGLWPGVLVGSTLGWRLLKRVRAEQSVAALSLPLAGPLSLAFVQPLVLSPIAFARARVGDLVPIAVATVLAMITRPAIAPLVVFSGVALTIGFGRLRRSEGNWAAAIPLVTLAIVALTAAPWSGAFRASVPLALPLLAALATGFIGFGIVAGRAAGSVIAALGVVALIATPLPLRFDSTTTIGPDEVLIVEGEPGASRVRIVISGGDVSGLAKDSLLGTVALLQSDGVALERPVTIGDVADWGAFRPRYWYRTRNPVPTRSARSVDGFAAGAFLHGAGVVEMNATSSIEGLRIEAASLGPGQTLQIHGIDWGDE